MKNNEFLLKSQFFFKNPKNLGLTDLNFPTEYTIFNANGNSITSGSMKDIASKRGKQIDFKPKSTFQRYKRIPNSKYVTKYEPLTPEEQKQYLELADQNQSK